MDEEMIFKAVNDFLSGRIEREIEQTIKKLKVEALTYEQEVPIREKYAISTWLDRVAENAHQVSLNISHVAKLTHSSSRASNVTDAIKQHKNLHLLTTQTANVAEFDLAYTNATLSPIAEFLSLSIDGETKCLGEFLAEDSRYLKRLSDDESIRKNWQLKIGQAYQPAEQSSHVLAKQVYFPLGEKDDNGDEKYHLISPVKSSALAHKVYLKIRESRDNKSPLYNAFQKKEWSDEIYVAYRDIGILSVTKSNHQNASKLNGARSGNLSLFNSAPPTWRPSNIIPQAKKLTMKQFFYDCYRDDCKALFTQLKRWIYFLEKDQAFLNAERKHFIAEIIQQICDKIFNQILLLQVRLDNNQVQLENVPAELLPFLVANRKKIAKTEAETEKIARLSQAEREVAITDLMQATSKWISEKIGDKQRNARYEKLWISLMKTPFRGFYAVMEAK